MSKIIRTTAQKAKNLQLAAFKQMLTLATNGFGLVAALAWNNVIQEFINEYVKKWFVVGSGIISLLVYAILITLLAVSVTLQLSSLVEKLEEKKEEKEGKEENKN